MDIFDIILNIHPIDRSCIEDIIPNLKTKTINKKSIIIKQGEVCKEMFFVRQGVFRNFVVKDGDDITRWFAEDGDIFTSMLSYVEGEPSIASVEALCDSEVYVASLTDVKRVLENSPEWSKWVNFFIMQGLSIMERRFDFLGCGDAYTRFCNFHKWRRQEVIRNIPLQHIASYLNVSPQTISRFRRKIAKEMKEKK